jgi:hypothetical protein
VFRHNSETKLAVQLALAEFNVFAGSSEVFDGLFSLFEGYIRLLKYVFNNFLLLLTHPFGLFFAIYTLAFLASLLSIF